MTKEDREFIFDLINNRIEKKNEEIENLRRDIYELDCIKQELEKRIVVKPVQDIDINELQKL